MDLTLLILLTRSLALLPTWPYQLELTISSAAVLQSPLSTAALMFWNLESRDYKGIEKLHNLRNRLGISDSKRK